MANKRGLEAEEEREKGISAFAHSPPAGNVVAELWDRWRRATAPAIAAPPKPSNGLRPVIRLGLEGYSDRPRQRVRDETNTLDQQWITGVLRLQSRTGPRRLGKRGLQKDAARTRHNGCR